MRYLRPDYVALALPLPLWARQLSNSSFGLKSGVTWIPGLRQGLEVRCSDPVLNAQLYSNRAQLPRTA